MEFPFLLCLNSSTLRPYNLDLESQLRVTAEAGFDGIEIWMRDLRSYMSQGNRPDRIRLLAEELNLSVVNGIAFFKWTDVNRKVRKAALEQAAHEVTVLAETGCTRIAAPPTGDVSGLSLEQLADNYERLLAIARPMGVDPVLEFWGRSAVLHSVSEAVQVLQALGTRSLPQTTRSGEPAVGNKKHRDTGRMQRPSVLLDLYHMYTGGSELAEMDQLNAEDIGLVHMNDYPQAPGRAEITDEARVMPGEGVGPVGEFLKRLHKIGFEGPISVELFRADYGHREAVETAAHARRATLAVWKEAASLL